MSPYHHYHSISTVPGSSKSEEVIRMAFAYIWLIILTVALVAHMVKDSREFGRIADLEDRVRSLEFRKLSDLEQRVKKIEEK